VAGFMPRDCLPIRTQTEDGQTQARVRCTFSLPPLPGSDMLHGGARLELSGHGLAHPLLRGCSDGQWSSALNGERRGVDIVYRRFLAR